MHSEGRAAAADTLPSLSPSAGTEARAIAGAPDASAARLRLRTLTNAAGQALGRDLSHRERLKAGVLQLHGSMYGAPTRTLLPSYA
jgi:hypothetical protein